MDETDEKIDISTAKHASRRLAKTAGTLDTKELGDLGELAFVLAASAKGLAVSKPYGDCRRYDLIVDSGRRLLRIQVKSVYKVSAGGSYAIRSSRRLGAANIPYTAKEIDFVAAYIAPRDIWYLVPINAIRRKTKFSLYPDGLKTSREECARFEIYREAWGLLDEWTIKNAKVAIP